MSLIIHTIVPDGIVVCSDTRTTHKDKNQVRYDDTCEKTIPFPNCVVVSHCGDNKIRDDLTVTQFLYDIRKTYGTTTTIIELPLKLLNEYIRQGGKGDTTFKTSGFYAKRLGYTYTVKTADKTIVLSKGPHDFGASYDGTTNIAHSIMNSGIDYKNLTIENAIELTKTCLETNITIAKFQKEQVIGGKCQIYVIDKLHNKTGWLKEDMQIVPDEKAPDDAFQKYEQRKFEILEKEILENNKLENQNENNSKANIN